MEHLRALVGHGIGQHEDGFEDGVADALGMDPALVDGIFYDDINDGARWRKLLPVIKQLARMHPYGWAAVMLSNVSDFGEEAIGDLVNYYLLPWYRDKIQRRFYEAIVDQADATSPLLLIFHSNACPIGVEVLHRLPALAAKYDGLDVGADWLQRLASTVILVTLGNPMWLPPVQRLMKSPAARPPVDLWVNIHRNSVSNRAMDIGGKIASIRSGRYAVSDPVSGALDERFGVDVQICDADGFGHGLESYLPAVRRVLRHQQVLF